MVWVIANSVPGRMGSEWSKYSKYWSLILSVGTSEIRATTATVAPIRIGRARDVTTCATQSTARSISPLRERPGARP
jgi:hypothetical protein